MDRYKEDRKEEQGWEALKLYFEFFKHFTTLSSAFTLVVIALQRSVGIGPRTTIVVLVVLGVNLVLSLCGLYVVMFRARKLDESLSPRGLPVLLMWLTIIAFFAGLFVMLILSIPPPAESAGEGCDDPLFGFLTDPEDCP